MNSRHISVYAPVHLDPTDSYGLIACELVRHLGRMNANYNIVSLGYHLHPNQDDEVRSYVDRPIVPAKGGILLGYPTVYKSYGDLANISPKIALTMFESTRIPEEWIPILNQMDAIITPSIFCHDSFKESGVTSPIFVFPLGICEVYKFQQRTSDAPFTFLSFLDRGRRKGGLKTMEAFCEEFGDDPRVKLIFKHTKVPPERTKLVSEDPNIEYIYEDYSVEQMYDLYTRCHCLVNPNKGEGFGLIPREFAATGGISLTTDWGGTADLLPLWGWPIEADIVKADWHGHNQFVGKDLGEWADPNLFQLKSLMRDVFNRKKYYLGKVEEKSKFAIQRYTWEFFTKSVLTLWEALNNGNRTRSPETSTEIRIPV